MVHPTESESVLLYLEMSVSEGVKRKGGIHEFHNLEPFQPITGNCVGLWRFISLNTYVNFFL